MIGTIIGDSIQLFALMTPPAVLASFLGFTRNYDVRQKRRIAFKTSLAIFILGFVFYVWGADMFELFGFTLDGFRIGSGVLLMLNAIANMEPEEVDVSKQEGDISIVPLAMPLGMGPASIGAVSVMGATAQSLHDTVSGIVALFCAALAMFILLLMGNIVSRALGATGIVILGKLTGLLLAAIASQVIFTGITGFLA